MKVMLLYSDREWDRPDMYFDEKNITQDLGLKLLYTVAAQQVIYENGNVKKVTDPDLFIKDTMRKVMMTPLLNEAEIVYRQEIVADCIQNEEFIRSLYATVTELIGEWEKLGRNVNGRNIGKDNISKLITRIYEFRLFLSGMKKIKTLLDNCCDSFSSKGLLNLQKRLGDAFPEELATELAGVSERLSFFINDEEDKGTKPTIDVPRIVMNCGIGEDFRMSDFVLEDVETQTKKYRNPKGTVAKIQGYFDAHTPDSVSCESGPQSQKQAALLEYTVVRYVMSHVEPFMRTFEDFFDALQLQTAFYVGAVNLAHQIARFEMSYCFPKVCGQNRLTFANLKEFVMSLSQRVTAVGNTCDIDEKMLIIITGANQGGKSTFLRSIGIAQVMMQSGLMVVADSFESGIFPNLFMHFTRREDSQMNSGRLDEELKRMDQIIEHLGRDSLVLLNESFATTTEKDGSEICYDIVKAMNEAGVKIITVTHLLSFAKRMHRETSEILEKGEQSDVTFFSAERKEDGSRTYRMIQSVPELTSFGLDLYEKIIENPQ